jgi:hypothetical protein
LLQRHLVDLILHLGRDAVPHPARCRRPILQRLRPAFEVAVIPAVEGPTRDAELIQRPLGRQVRLLDDPDDLELLGCRIPYSSPSPSAIILYGMSRPFSPASVMVSVLEKERSGPMSCDPWD